jgi:glutathione S-transferase
MELDNYNFTTGATLCALLVYFWTVLRVGAARGKYKIQAPAVTGTPEFDRTFRIQQNTMEQLILFLPSLWLFAASIGDKWAGIAGLVWVIGRILYTLGYSRAADKRSTGFAISMAATFVLLIGAMVGWFL